MFVFATPIVDWSAMWKICLVALAAGAGVVVFFGFLLLGLKFAQGPAKGVSNDAAAGDAQSGGTERPRAREHASAVSHWRSCAAWCVSRSSRSVCTQ